jgi:hypothetical protein
MNISFRRLCGPALIACVAVSLVLVGPPSATATEARGAHPSAAESTLAASDPAATTNAGIPWTNPPGTTTVVVPWNGRIVHKCGLFSPLTQTTYGPTQSGIWVGCSLGDGIYINMVQYYGSYFQTLRLTVNVWRTEGTITAGA